MNETPEAPGPPGLNKTEPLAGCFGAGYFINATPIVFWLLYSNGTCRVAHNSVPLGSVEQGFQSFNGVGAARKLPSKVDGSIYKGDAWLFIYRIEGPNLPISSVTDLIGKQP